MRVSTWLGTRPEIIRLSRILPLLDAHCDHRVVFTGQNYDDSLSTIFFRDLALRPPDIHLGIRESSFGAQAAAIIQQSFEWLSRERPDRVLILGDTNSGLAAISAARLGIPVYHMEAGNRSFDVRVPEEINRRLIDHCSTILMPYTERSKEHLVREGFERRQIAVIGNPIFEVLEHYAPQIDASDVLTRLGISSRRYFAVTLHRAENVDDPDRLRSFFRALETLSERQSMPAVVSVHPRTRSRLDAAGIRPRGPVRLIEPLGFFDFVRLEKDAACVLTDSGTVQEETCILGVPNVTLRDTTERAETIEGGSGILSGADPEAILRTTAVALNSGPWTVPEEYRRPNVSQTVAKIVLGYAI